MIDWSRVGTVFLDMDGTLLDLNYDNHFWLEHVPRRYAEKHGVEEQHARQDLTARYRSRAGTLEWYSVDFWSDERVALVTNAHHKSLALKMSRTGLEAHFDALITSHKLGLPKERAEFWQALQAVEPFDPGATLLVDDSLPVLHAAQAYGIAHLVAVYQPDTRQPRKDVEPFQAIESFLDIMPRPMDQKC
ncbi:MAG: HAD-superfamily hydrolase subfamily variant 3 [Proteobacteria bacterium]|nr:HAD-superfamily hydrolase subfamily variant 3 [Pseudomonadota bacterium]